MSRTSPATMLRFPNAQQRQQGDLIHARGAQWLGVSAMRPEA